MLASIIDDVKQPAVVPLSFEFSGRSGNIKIGDAIENRFAPIENPVTHEEEELVVRVVGGMEYSGEGEAQIVRSETLRSIQRRNARYFREKWSAV